MPDEFTPERSEDPFAAIKRAVDAHAQVATASSAAGAAVQAEKVAAPAEPERPA